MEKHIKEDLEDLEKSKEDLQKYFEVFEKFCKLNNKLTYSQHSLNNLHCYEFHSRVKSILDEMATKLYGRKLTLQIVKERIREG